MFHQQNEAKFSTLQGVANVVIFLGNMIILWLDCHDYYLNEFLGSINPGTTSPKLKIANVKQLNDFQFDVGDSIIARRVSGIGCGRKIDATDNVNTFTTTFDAVVVNQDQLDESGRNKRFTRQELKLPGKIEVGIDIDAEDEEEAQDDEVIAKSSSRGLFHCPNEGKKFNLVNLSS